TGFLIVLPQSAGSVSQQLTEPFDAGRQIVQPVERVADLNISHLLELVDQRRERHPQILNGCFEGAGEQVLDGFPGVSELLAESDPPAHGPLRSPPEPFDDLPDSVKDSAERSEEHTSELQSRENLVCRLLLEKKKT